MAIGIIERRVYRRTQRQADAARARSADLATPRVLASVSEAQRRQLSWAQSPHAPEGEQVVQTCLEIVARYGWTSLDRLVWQQAGLGTTPRVAVGPGGVVVIDERLWTGTLRVDGGVLRHNGYRCENELGALADAVAVITALLPPTHRTTVQGVICVPTRDFEPQEVAGAQIVGRLHLASLLAAMEPRLNPFDVADLTRGLVRALGPHESAAIATPMPMPSNPVWLPMQSVGDGNPGQAAGPHSVPYPHPALVAASAGRFDPATGTPTAEQLLRWRSGAARVSLALLIGLLAFQNSEAISASVTDWVGSDTTTAQATE